MFWETEKLASVYLHLFEDVFMTHFAKVWGSGKNWGNNDQQLLDLMEIAGVILGFNRFGLVSKTFYYQL